MAHEKILIVEDEPLIGLALKETIEILGYEVVGVIDSADDVLHTFIFTKPDLVLLDIRLRSYTDGTDAARRLRLVSSVPVIFLSAYGSEETRTMAGKSSPSAFLSKPVSDTVLAYEIRKALDSSREPVLSI